MSRFDELSDRAFQFAEEAVRKLKNADLADKVLASGAALSVARGGAKVALKVARRNPLVAAATIAGVGVLAYAAYRRREKLKGGDAVATQARRMADAGVGNADVVAPEAASGAAE